MQQATTTQSAVRFAFPPAGAGLRFQRPAPALDAVSKDRAEMAVTWLRCEQ